jgi:transcriptional regulator with XRE-family HTH domain
MEESSKLSIPPKSKKIIGLLSRLDFAIKGKGLSISQAAAIIGVSPPTIVGWLNGEHSPRGLTLRILKRNIHKIENSEAIDLDVFKDRMVYRQLRGRFTFGEKSYLLDAQSLDEYRARLHELATKYGIEVEARP